MRDHPLIKPTRVRIPTVLKDEWQEEAACAGLHTTDIDPILCGACPVKIECRLLYHEVNDELRAATGDSNHMDGTWGGHSYGATDPSKTNSGGGRYPKGTAPVNGGLCACGQPAYRRGECSMHYQRTNVRNKSILEVVETNTL